MPCSVIKFGGTSAIICGRGQGKSHPCDSCAALATIQCDYPVRRDGKMTTCDRWQCSSCAVQIGPNVHYCKPHAKMGAPKL